MTHTRTSLFPIVHHDLWDMYKKAVASFWIPEEIDLAKDWEALSHNEQHFLKHVLAFFAGSDMIVVDNLTNRFCQDANMMEAAMFYGFQIAMENIHTEVYAQLIECYVDDKDERAHLLSAVSSIPCIKKKAVWANKWTSSSKSFSHRLIAFAAVEGIMFSSSFAAIFWLKSKGKMPGLAFSNQMIARDEGLHCDFACLLYSKHDKLPRDQVLEIICEAAELEAEFACESLPVDLLGMNSAMIRIYVQFVADRLIVALGYAKHYNVQNPFDFMENISLQEKTNFFEQRVGEYRKAGSMATIADREFTTTAEF
ncbi:ribonucleotide reductase small subunit [Blyttiomyces helicus]|uniref:Ribonucleotide reductase small subunit n=1 Tax=Blyttiomyces helicus TaxID=388810 RepID=A0A4P9WB44_9FUNG|nr:ribonucleotide reductase small subunit [Blyttiomyces helicus]|eukprot:RKO88805.1 ribonucleotide reductase small subunit [Blyttiomyces helicus]